MRIWIRLAISALLAMVAGTILCWWLFVVTLNPPPSHVLAALKYLVISGGTSLSLGTALLLLIARYVPRLSAKIWLACIAGSAGSLMVVLVTPYLMFAQQTDLRLLEVTLVYSLVIGLVFGLIVATLVTRQIMSLRDGAARLGSGQFNTRVEVRGNDEIAMLAETFNTMSTQLGNLFQRQQRLEQTRKDLTAAVSHDLRTPLTSIRAMVEAINDGVVSEPEKVKHYLALIAGESKHLQQLIDDLFELSRVDSDGMALRLSSVPVTELVAETVEGLQIQAEVKGVRLAARCAPDMPPLSLDGPRMQRVLVNLIQNALQHTPAGGEVCVEAGRVNGHVRLSVIDTGEGIEADDQERVFEQFYRGEKSRSRESGGTGLGLAIARAIVEAHDGTIGVESTPGRGSRFVVTL
ncbi:MAG: sensor histidine kinase [Chloroflexota bacterium]|nr:MAG: hypothetical protein DLM70_16095 [Chloroflexota bacterium]